MHLNGVINSVCIMLKVKPRVRVFTKSHVNTKPLYKTELYFKWQHDESHLGLPYIKTTTKNQTNYFYDLRCN